MGPVTYFPTVKYNPSFRKNLFNVYRKGVHQMAAAPQIEI